MKVLTLGRDELVEAFIVACDRKGVKGDGYSFVPIVRDGSLVGVSVVVGKGKKDERDIKKTLRNGTLFIRTGHLKEGFPCLGDGNHLERIV